MQEDWFSPFSEIIVCFSSENCTIPVWKLSNLSHDQKLQLDLLSDCFSHKRFHYEFKILQNQSYENHNSILTFPKKVSAKSIKVDKSDNFCAYVYLLLILSGFGI